MVLPNAFDTVHFKINFLPGTELGEEDIGVWRADFILGGREECVLEANGREVDV